MKSGAEQEIESATLPHVNALFQTALQLIGDRAAAGELVQEVCGSARASGGRRAQRADWRSMLFKILIQRARCRSATTTQDGVAVLSGIPRAQREIILLVDCQDFSYQQAADILGLSRDAVAEGVILGRTRLEATLQNYAAEVSAT
jgi:DNA-directed RNA polymerase specialized sigma24 family protein